MAEIADLTDDALAEAVAREVFKWRLVVMPPGWCASAPNTAVEAWEIPGGDRPICHLCETHRRMWPEDIAAAFEVVERMREVGGDVFDACDGAVVGKRPGPVGERVCVALGNAANGGGSDVGNNCVA